MDPILPNITPIEECIARIANKDEHEQEAHQEINNIIQRILVNYGKDTQISTLVEKLKNKVVHLGEIASEVESTHNETLQQELLEEQQNIRSLISELRSNILKKQ